MIIEYNTSVFTPAGWRGVTVRAEAVRTKPKTASVKRVITVDGTEPVGYASRTGTKRQCYNAKHVALRELGKAKRLSACTIINEGTP